MGRVGHIYILKGYVPYTRQPRFLERIVRVRKPEELEKHIENFKDTWSCIERVKIEKL